MSEQTLTLTEQDAYLKRIGAWLSERFPIANGILSMVLFFSVAAVLQSDANVFVQWGNWLGGMMLWGHFFVLRIFDEHKDYEIDLINHPNRVIQSGVVKLNEIRVLGYLTVAAQIIYSAYLGWPVFLAWAAVFAYTGLMGKEFFVGEWLQARLIMYAATHMLVMPLMAVWCALLANQGDFSQLNLLQVSLLAALFFFSGFAYEVFRKIRAPESEVSGVDTYSSILGYRTASVLAFLFTSGFYVAVLLLLPWQIHSLSAKVACAVITAGHIFLGTRLLMFCLRPTPRAAKTNDTLSGLYFVVVLAALIIALS